jgi:hypothetical protein
MAHSNAALPLLSFQIIVDSRNFFLSPSPSGGRIRCNITGIEADQIAVIADSIIDAGPEASSLLFEALKNRLGNSALLVDSPESKEHPAELTSHKDTEASISATVSPQIDKTAYEQNASGHQPYGYGSRAVRSTGNETDSGIQADNESAPQL